MSFYKLAGLGALAVVFVLLAFLVLIVVSTMPDWSVASAAVNTVLIWLCVAGVVAALIVVHLVFARILLREARRERRATPSGAR